MFTELGKIINIKNEEEIEIQLSEINDGTNLFDDFIVYKKNKDFRIYNRICDHAGGKIISREGKTICPMHNWRFFPETGLYENGIQKTETDFVIKNDILKFKKTVIKPDIKKLSDKNNQTKIRFFNHAFLKIFGENFSFSIDPWAVGPAFNTGWWLKNKTKNDWIENLNNSDFIYISHNHPDHLHPLTLSMVDKNIPIIVPKYNSDSAGKYMEDLGFRNIYRLNFNAQYNLNGTDLIITLFKSGDFREDSGIYFSNGNFTALLSVDSNLLNFGRYPNVDFYGGSFAGGASGYPLMFDNYKIDEQIKIANKQKSFVKSKVIQDLKKIMPNYYLPYAGFFEEKLSRDILIKKNNKKNTIDDYKKFCIDKNIKLLDINMHDFFIFNGNILTSTKNLKIPKTQDLRKEDYLEYYKKEYNNIDENYLSDYFINSGFKDDLHLYILITDDNFKLLNFKYFIDFSQNTIKFNKIDFFNDKVLKTKTKYKQLVLKVRKESFLNTLYNKLPWEDLSIGFQCKVIRNPNAYNIKFWHHFTNVYTTSKNVRSKTECGSCSKITQIFDDQIYAKKILNTSLHN